MNIKIDITKIEINTERLLLRAWKLSDLDDLFNYASIPGVGEMAGWPHHENRNESLRILNMFIEDKNVFAIEYNHKVIGSIGVHFYKEKLLPEFDHLKGAEIGYVLSKEYWGQGLVPEATKAVCKYLFDELKFDFLVCGHFLENHQSEKVQMKCGFKHYKIVDYKTQCGEIKKTYISLLKNNKL